MLDWLRRTEPLAAGIYLPPTADTSVEGLAARFQAAGATTEIQREGEAGLWRIKAAHPEWGRAELQPYMRLAELVDATTFAGNLTNAEKAAAQPPLLSFLLTMPARKGHVLADRKSLLRWAGALLADDGPIAIDFQSRLPWSRAALADELAHDADVDVEALYVLHQVFDPDARGDPQSYWLHTHGLAEIGAFDLDVLRPHPDFVAQANEGLSSIVSQALAGKIQPDTAEVQFGHPNGVTRLVPADVFMREASPELTRLRDAADHDQRRAVLCEPAGGGGLSFLRRRASIEPLRFAQRPVPEQFVSLVTEAETNLQAERARSTLPLLRRYLDEFADIDHYAIVKLGYPTTNDSREHLWFELHELGPDWVDATLQNKPFWVDLQPGARERRPLDLLTDWRILTPQGQITPRSSHVARILRESGPAR